MEEFLVGILTDWGCPSQGSTYPLYYVYWWMYIYLQNKIILSLLGEPSGWEAAALGVLLTLWTWSGMLSEGENPLKRLPSILAPYCKAWLFFLSRSISRYFYPIQHKLLPHNVSMILPYCLAFFGDIVGIARKSMTNFPRLTASSRNKILWLSR